MTISHRPVGGEPDDVVRIRLGLSRRVAHREIGLGEPKLGGEGAEQRQRLAFARGEVEEQRTGRRLGESGGGERETAAVAAQDDELLARDPAEPVAGRFPSAQQVDEPVALGGGSQLVDDVAVQAPGVGSRHDIASGAGSGTDSHASVR